MEKDLYDAVRPMMALFDRYIEKWGPIDGPKKFYKAIQVFCLTKDSWTIDLKED